MTTSVSKRTAISVLLAVLLSGITVRAQVIYDPEYDEEAAGENEYSDVEAAGMVDFGAEISEDGAEASSDASAKVGAKSSPKESEELHTWEMGAGRHHSGLDGSTGLLHILEAGSDEAGTFGVGVHGAFFHHEDYLYYGDRNTHMWGGLTLRITPLDFLEVYAGLESSANSNNKNDPELFQALGDFYLGAKGYYPVLEWLTLGGRFGLNFLNPVGDVSFSLKGTSVGADILSTFDFGHFAPNFPLRGHLNVGYYFDNSGKLVEGLEKRRGGCGTDSDNDGLVEYEGCLNPVERFALNINRNDQFRMGLGFDLALPYISPIIEYNLEIPVNRQDFVCPENTPGSPDSCMAQEGGKGFRQLLTFGVRVLPPVESLAIDIGVDVGVSGYAPTVHELAAEVPYEVIFGVSYNFDPFPEELPPPPPPPPAPVVEEPPPPPAIVKGYVHDADSKAKAIPDATVAYMGHEFNPQLSDEQGRFSSYPLPEGTHTISVSSDGYETTTLTVEVPKTGEVELDCPLKAKPKKGTVAFKVETDAGKPIPGAQVRIKGMPENSGGTGPDGEYSTEILVNSYQALIEKEDYFKKIISFDAQDGTRVEVKISLSKKPARPQVSIKKSRIVIGKKIHFEKNSDQIKADSFALLDEIADLLISNTQIKKVEIQGHTDNSGKRAYNLDLSDRRAQAVRSYLVDSGVGSDRLEARGFGPDQPLAPNITRQGRARNRRVEFHIKETATETE